MNNTQNKTMNKTTQATFKYSLLASCIAMALPVHAQTAPESSTGAKETGLAEVVVTAERRKASVQKTSISIVAVTGEQLKEKAQTTIESVLREIPAVTVSNSPQGAQVYVRGVGSNGDANWIDPSVALMLDNIYSGRAEQVYGGMYDVSRVEVLRGPQGTLYGRNATGGVVNVLTNNPTNKFEGAVNAQLGNYNLHHLDGAVNFPVNDVLAIRAAAVSDQRDGYFSNNGRASDFFGGRLKALVKPNSTFSLLGTVDYSRERGDGSTTAPRAVSGMPPLAAVFAHPWTTDYTDPWQVDEYHPADKRDLQFVTYSLQADWDLGWANLTYIPAATHSKRTVTTDLIGGTANDSVLTPTTTEEDQYTHELRLASAASSALKWTVGLYTLKSTNMQTATSASTSTGTADFTTYGDPGASTSRAVFGQLTYPVTDTLRATVGLRNTHDDKLISWGVKSIESSTVGAYDSGLHTVSNNYSSTTYKLGLEYDLNAKSMVYGQISTGYKAGGYSTTAWPALAYAPEKLKAYELGIKSRLLNNTLQLNAELYSYNYDGFQVQYAVFNAATPNQASGAAATVFQQYVVNAGQGKNRGFEIESKYKLTPNDQLSVALSYTDAHYGDFTETALQYLNGTKVATVSPKTVNLGYEHVFDLESGASISAKLQTKLSDGYRITLESGLPAVPDSLYYQANFHRSDLSVTYRSADESWTVGAWLKNIENKAQVTALMPWSRVQITDPRTFGVNLGYKF